MQPVPSIVPKLQTSYQDFLTDSPENDQVLLDPPSDQSPIMSPVTTPGSTPASSEVGSPPPDPSYIPRRSTRQRVPPVWHQDFVTNSAATVTSTINHQLPDVFHCFQASMTNSLDPISFKSTVKIDHWVTAMNQELDALELNKTWEVTSLPPGKVAIGCKWIFKTKYHPDGTIDKHKARLVILGCHQQYGINYAETFAPVAKLTTVRTLLAVAAMEN